MSDVFISYSRKDITFARLLNKALEETELETWIDMQDIHSSADWLAGVYEAIEAVTTFIFLILGYSTLQTTARFRTSMLRGTEGA